jgi:thiol-disulfide isomerase/thioredoxin
VKLYSVFIALFLLSLTSRGVAIEEGEALPAEVASAIRNSNIKIDGKVVLLDFWASWCTPCGLSLPWLENVSSRWPDQVTVVTVNVDKKRADAARMLEKLSVSSLSVIYDPDGMHPETCALKTMPSSFLFNSSHRLVQEYRGFREGDKVKIENDIAMLLEKGNVK